MKSNNIDNLQLSAQRGLWATHRNNEAKLNDAFATASNVVLIFSVNETRHFQVRSSDRRHFLMRGSDRRHFQVRGSDKRHFQVRGSAKRHFLVRGSDKRHFQVRGSDQRYFQVRGSDKRHFLRGADEQSQSSRQLQWQLLSCL